MTDQLNVGGNHQHFPMFECSSEADTSVGSFVSTRSRREGSHSFAEEVSDLSA